MQGESQRRKGEGDAEKERHVKDPRSLYFSARPVIFIFIFIFVSITAVTQGGQEQCSEFHRRGSKHNSMRSVPFSIIQLIDFDPLEGRENGCDEKILTSSSTIMHLSRTPHSPPQSSILLGGRDTCTPAEESPSLSTMSHSIPTEKKPMILRKCLTIQI